MKHKKKHKLPSEKASSYALFLLLAFVILWIILSISSYSESRFSGNTYGEVTDIFYVMPNTSGRWDRKCEVSFSVNGQMYKIHIDSPASVQAGDSCKVRYRTKRPGEAFVEWH
jgi:hypothetical protein